MKNKRGSINYNSTLRLWVKAGGRCEICNKYLLEDELTTTPINLAERAHNVGISGGKRSARSNNDLDFEERNNEENLLLLCRDHHKLIDTYSEKYPVELLHEIKLEHEKIIKFLTGMTDDKKSVVLRMMNDIRGSSILISNEEVRETLYKCDNRYPEFILKHENNIEINLKNLPEPVSNSYWKMGKHIIDDVVTRQINPLVNEKILKRLSIFALARIPLLIYLGFKLGDKIPVDIYQKQRNINEDWIWDKNSKPIEFKYKRINVNKNFNRFALILSLSGKISKKQLPINLEDSFNIYEISPIKILPNRSIIKNKKTLNNFRNALEIVLRKIENECYQYSDLFIFPAIPISASIVLGREFLKGITPNITIFDLEKGKFIKTYKIKIK